MKICVLTHTFPRNENDTAAAFMKEFCDGLVENNVEVVLVAPYDPEFYRPNEKFKIVTYKYIWPNFLHVLGYSRAMQSDVRLRKLNYLLLPFFLFFGFLTLMRVVKEEKIDAISVHWILPSGVIALLVSKLTRIPYTVTLPGTDAYLAYKNKFFGYIAKIIAVNSSALISNSRWHLNRILNLGVELPIEEVITYPVDTTKFYPTSKKTKELKQHLNILNNQPVLLAVGRLVYKKGFDYLIEAMPEIIRKFPTVTLLIGGEGDLKKDLAELIKNLGLTEHVKLIGNIDRGVIADYYNLAYIMVAPSILDEEGNIDGRPLVILESMSCGKPQVVTNLPGISDALIDGVNALLVPQKNSKALAKAVIKLLTSKDLREKMGQANRIKAVDMLSTAVIGRKYMEIFRKIVIN